MRIWRNNTGAATQGGRYVRFGVVGQADISGIVRPGTRLEIEVKGPKGVQRPAQKRFEHMIRAMGGIYILARSLDDVRRVLG